MDLAHFYSSNAQADLSLLVILVTNLFKHPVHGVWHFLWQMLAVYTKIRTDRPCSDLSSQYFAYTNGNRITIITTKVLV